MRPRLEEVLGIHAVCYIRDTLRGTTSQISNENKEQRLVDISQGRDKSPFYRVSKSSCQK